MEKKRRARPRVREVDVFAPDDKRCLHTCTPDRPECGRIFMQKNGVRRYHNQKRLADHVLGCHKYDAQMAKRDPPLTIAERADCDVCRRIDHDVHLFAAQRARLEELEAVCAGRRPWGDSHVDEIDSMPELGEADHAGGAMASVNSDTIEMCVGKHANGKPKTDHVRIESLILLAQNANRLLEEAESGSDAKFVITRRLCAGLRQGEIAKIFDVGQSSVSRWAREKDGINADGRVFEKRRVSGYSVLDALLFSGSDD